jgi:hypothetical protein
VLLEVETWASRGHELADCLPNKRADYFLSSVAVFKMALDWIVLEKKEGRFGPE